MVELKKRLNLGSIMRKRSTQDVTVDSNADTPEANAARGVRLFCESGAANSGEEVLHLPTIVESAVASPVAAQAAAQQIRKFLSKENYKRPHVQYNAVMLIRILADNPGQSFTKNLDKNFADTVKNLLRHGGDDRSVAQIIHETLDSMEREKAYDTNLNTLFAMWRKEKGLMANAAKTFGPRTLNAPGWSPSTQVHGGFSSGRSTRGLPPPAELAGRIEEARTSAKLLLQLVQSTPANELLGNELVKEFAERCVSAQRSIQGYIACDNPAPDDDTMLTLIETNEQLSLAASKHQRAILQARRLMGASPSPPVNNAPSGIATQVYDPPSFPPRDAAPTIPPPSTDTTRNTIENYKNNELPLPPSLQAGPNQQRDTEENPFADHYTSSYTPPPGPPPSNTQSNGYGGPTTFQSTPSYLGRQESAANHLTMHGGQASPDHAQPQTPDRGLAPQQAHDVSPIAERNTVTYRY